MGVSAALAKSERAMDLSTSRHLTVELSGARAGV